MIHNDDDADGSANRLRIAELVAQTTTIGALALTYLLAAYTVELNPVASELFAAVGYPTTAALAVGAVGLAFAVIRRASSAAPRTALAGGLTLASVGVLDVTLNLWRLSTVGLPESTRLSTIAGIVAAGALGAVAPAVVGRLSSHVPKRSDIGLESRSLAGQSLALAFALLMVTSVVAAGLSVSAIAEAGAAGTLLDDFEDGDVAGWEEKSGTITTTTDSPFEGQYSAIGTGTGSVVHSGTGGTPETISFALYTIGGGSNRPAFTINDGGGVIGPNLAPNRDFNGYWHYYDGSSWVQTDLTVLTHQWTIIEITNIDWGSNTYDLVVKEADGTVHGSVTGISFTNSIGSFGEFDITMYDGDTKMDYLTTGSVPIDRTVSGTVTGSDGNGIGSADITVTQSGSVVTTTTTASDGSYSVSLSDGEYTIEANASGYTSASQSVNVSGSAVSGVDFGLGAFGVSGNVSAPDGSGLGGATVEATQSGSTVATTTTSSSGSYSLALSSGTYEIAVESSRYGTETKTVEVSGPETANFRFGRELPFELVDETEQSVFSDDPTLTVEGSSSVQTTSFNHDNMAYVGVQDGRTYDLTVVSDEPAVYDFKGYKVQETLVEGILYIPPLDDGGETTPTNLTAVPEGENMSLELAALREELNATALRLNSMEPVEEFNYTIYNGTDDPVYNGSREFEDPTQYYEGRISDNITGNASHDDGTELEYGGTWENGSTFNGTADLSGSFGSSSGSDGVLGPTGGSNSGGSPVVGFALVGGVAFAALRYTGADKQVAQAAKKVVGRLR